MIPPCRNCNGEGQLLASAPAPERYCPRCQGSQLDEAWVVTVAPVEGRPGYVRLRIAYGAHAATRPLLDEVMDEHAVDLLVGDILGGRIRRGLILRDKR